MKNYYDVLEVSRKASKDTINKVFRMHMKTNHPDLFQGEEKTKAEEKAKELTEAYNVLSDDVQRAKYDEELNSEEQKSDEQIQELIKENEYLKQVINQKDSYIQSLTGGYVNNANTQNQYASQKQYYENNAEGGYGFNGFSPRQQSNPYEGLSIEELKRLKKEETKRYYMSLLKEFGVKILIFILLIIVLIISLNSSFKDLKDIFNTNR